MTTPKERDSRLSFSSELSRSPVRHACADAGICIDTAVLPVLASDLPQAENVLQVEQHCLAFAMCVQENLSCVAMGSTRNGGRNFTVEQTAFAAGLYSMSPSANRARTIMKPNTAVAPIHSVGDAPAAVAAMFASTTATAASTTAKMTIEGSFVHDHKSLL